jgi:hypothetical protein
MTVTARHAVVVLAVLMTACDGAARPASFVIPGPTVPSPLPTVPPYVWDTREELAIWVENPLAQGPVALEGNGAEAFIRIAGTERAWVLRGPDISPRATDVRTLRIRYRWRTDADLSLSADRFLRAGAHFQTTAPLQPYYYGIASAGADLEPRSDWADITFVPGQFTPPIDVGYCYLNSLGDSLGIRRGVLEIDRIELVR